MENKEYLISLFKGANTKQELLFLKWKLKNLPILNKCLMKNL